MRSFGGGCLVGVGVPFPGLSYGEAGLDGEQASLLRLPPVRTAPPEEGCSIRTSSRPASPAEQTYSQ